MSKEEISNAIIIEEKPDSISSTSKLANRDMGKSENKKEMKIPLRNIKNKKIRTSSKERLEQKTFESNSLLTETKVSK